MRCWGLTKIKDVNPRRHRVDEPLRKELIRRGTALSSAPVIYRDDVVYTSWCVDSKTMAKPTRRFEVDVRRTVVYVFFFTI